jgi:MFS family permease
VTDRTPARSRERLGSRYWRLWTAGTISNLGDGANAAALPLLVTTITRDPRLVAGMQVFFTLPWLLFALPAGALVDRLDRKQVMWRVNVVRAVLLGGVAAMALTGTATIWALYAVALAIGLCETLFDNAAQAMVPAVVHPSLLEKANGRQYAAELVANAFVGPPLGGLLFAAAASIPFFLDSATFVVSAILIATLGGSYRTAAAEARAASGEKQSIRSDIAEGIRWLRHHKLLRTLALLLSAANFANGIAMATLVLFATGELGATEATFGLMLAAMSIGGLVAGLVGDRIVRVVGAGRTVVGSAIVYGIVMPVTVGLAPNWWMAALLLSFEGLAAVLWNIVTVSLRQQLIPAELFGRVNSVYRFLGLGAMPIGALIGGLVASVLGLRAPWFVAAGVFTVALAAGLAAGFSPGPVDAARASAVERSLDEAERHT